MEQVYPCFVVRGRVTAYSEQPITDATVRKLDDALQAAIETGGLEGSDTRVVGMTWRDLVDDPIPGGSPTPSPGSGTIAPVIEPRSESEGLETWAIALIASVSVLLLCTGYLCFRRTSHAPVFDDEDDNRGASDCSDEFNDEG